MQKAEQEVNRRTLLTDEHGVEGERVICTRR